MNDLIFKGGEAKFNAIVAANTRAVTATAAAYCHVLSDAEDIAQETFIFAYYNFGKLRDPSRITAWLCGIARNYALKLREKTRFTLPLEHAKVTAASPETGYISRESRSELRNAVKTLPDASAETLMLRYYGDKSIAEIAEILDLPIGTVKRRLHDGREKLKISIGESEKEIYSMTNEKIIAEVAAAVAKAERLYHDNRFSEARSECDDLLGSFGERSNAAFYLRAKAELYGERARAKFFTDGRGAVIRDDELSVAAARLYSAETGDTRLLCERLTSLSFDYGGEDRVKRELTRDEAIKIAESTDGAEFSAELLYWKALEEYLYPNFDLDGAYPLLKSSLEYALSCKGRDFRLCEGAVKRIPAMAGGALKNIDYLREQGGNEGLLWFCTFCQLLKSDGKSVKSGANYGWDIQGGAYDGKIHESASGVFDCLPLIIDDRLENGEAIKIHGRSYEESPTVTTVTPSNAGAVTVAAGSFEGCLCVKIVTVTEAEQSVAENTLYFAESVGIIRADTRLSEKGEIIYSHSATLDSYKVSPSGESFSRRYFPLAEGNEWSYIHQCPDAKNENLTVTDRYCVGTIDGDTVYLSNFGAGIKAL